MLCIYSVIMVGDYVLSAGLATDSGPRLHSNLAWSLWETAAGPVAASCGDRGDYSV